VAVAGAALTAIAIVVQASVASANTAHPAAAVPRWRIVERAPVGYYLRAVIAPSTTSAWALGSAPEKPPVNAAPVALHWNGHRWASVSMPSPAHESGVECAAASPSTNAWAFTGSLNNVASAVRLRNGRWAKEKVFTNGGTVSDCHVLSPHDVWVFGGGAAAGSPFIGTWHLNGSRWSQVKTSVSLFRASVDAARGIWAIGEKFPIHGAATPEVVRWNGHSFAQVGSIVAALPPRPHGGAWDAVAINALSGRNVWARVTDGVSARVLHWNGRRWQLARPTSSGYYLPTAVSDGHGGWWAFSVSTPVGRYALHEAHGRWTKFALPQLHGHQLLILSMIHVPRSDAMLAVGYTQTTSGSPTSVVLAFGNLPR
jgi:hypothetical protein